MFSTLPQNHQDFMTWPWSKIEPYFKDLAERPLSEDNLAEWLGDWTKMANRIYETYSRLALVNTQDTTDEAAEKRFHGFLENIFPPAMAADQQLKLKLFETGLEPEGFEMPLRNMKADVAIFREENLPLLTKERKMGSEYDKLIGAQTIEWEGEEYTISQLAPIMAAADRGAREQIAHQTFARLLADRESINELWGKYMALRAEIAQNADFDNYRGYQWQVMKRFDYTPADCQTFHDAIEQVAVPAAARLYEKYRQRLGAESVRPWDLDLRQNTYPFHYPPIKPYEQPEALETTSAAIFDRVDSELGAHFATMRQENLLDLPNRKGKAPGAYCTSFPVAQRPFIFMNAVGLHADVQTLLHEAGHAFHVFESVHLPYHQQTDVNMEFAEVASMAMELLAAPYLTTDEDGFYSPKDAARARIEHLEGIILFWPYMAVVDAFQHWVYENPAAAAEPANCDAKWSALWDRFIPALDWTGMEDVKATGWHRKLHIHQIPFYYIEYGLAQLGAVQIWRNALSDQAASVAAYRKALALGGTVPLPELYKTAGARFAFDAATLGQAVDLVERTIAELETV